MKKVFFKTMMGAGFACMLLTGCVESVKDLYDPNYVIQQYQKNWTDSIGQIDPNQTWNMAKRVTAEIDLAGVALGGSLVNIYTANPLTPSTKLLATATIADYDAIEFDMPKALNYVFVTAKNSRGLVVNGYFKVADGIVTVGKNGTRATSTCPVTIGNAVDVGICSYWTGTETVTVENEFYLLDGVEKNSSDPWQYGDFIEIIGKYGVFAEGGDNLGKAGVKSGVEYVTKETGPVELTYIYGATQNYNSFGYFYYTNESEIPQAKRYVLLKDARPRTSITVDSEKISIVGNNGEEGDDMGLATAAADNKWSGTVYDDENKCAEEPAINITVDEWGYETREEINQHFYDKVVGSTYKLTYFDEDGNASYDFPAGVTIVFFVYDERLAKKDNTDLCHKVYYSRSEENARYGRANQVAAVTYKYGDNLILGFEDSPYAPGDFNDILFLVKGNIEEEDVPQLNPNVPTAQEWILACEDLGTTDDFDFNDVVFSVKYVAGATTAVITPLAAGGTMPAQICYNGTVIGKEIHEWFGVSTKTMINTTSRGKAAESVEISVGDDFTMTKEMGGFTIDVNNGTTTVVAPAAGAAPQMILVSDANWSWPYERVRISDAYGLFAEWASSSTTNEDWYATPTGKTVDGDYSNSSTGEEGTGGGESGEGGDNGEDDNNDNEEGGNGDNTGGSSSDVSEYGTLIAAEDLVHGQLVPAEYFANVGDVCTLTVIGKYVNITFRNPNWVNVHLESNENEISEITLEGALLESAKKGEMYYDCYNVVPVIYVK